MQAMSAVARAPAVGDFAAISMAVQKIFRGWGGRSLGWVHHMEAAKKACQAEKQ